MPSMPDTEAPARARDALGKAVARLRDDCASGTVPVPEPALLDEEIERVVAAVQRRLEGKPQVELPAEQADRVAILDALRARMVASWPEDERGLLETMRAFEAVRADLSPGGGGGALPPGILSPWGHRLLREVAHTLRSPMSSVVMLAATMRDGARGDVSPLHRKHLGLVYRATTTLANLSNDLLALTGARQDLLAEPVVFSVPELVDDVVAVVAPIAEERGVELQTEVDGAGSRSGQPLALSRALTNLALNAALLVREGRLSITASGEGEEVAFMVAATAATEGVHEVFDVFPSPPGADDYTLSHRGLGFAIARRRIGLMGGELRVESGPEGGLTFSFRLRLPPAG